MRKVFLADWKRAVLSVGFLAGVIGLVLAGICSTLPAVAYVEENMVLGSRAKCSFLIEAAVHSDLILMVIPLVSSLAYGAAFSDELKYRFAMSGLVRTSWRRYLGSKVLVTALSGGLMVLIGLLLILGGITLAFLPGQEQWIPSGKSVFLYFADLAGRMVFLCLSGSLWALLGGFSAAVMKNKYMAYTTPFILYYVLDTFQKRYYPTLDILNPREWASPVVIQTWHAGLMLSLAGLAVGVAYMTAMERRLKDV